MSNLINSYREIFVHGNGEKGRGKKQKYCNLKTRKDHELKGKHI